jgi:hypothetical protein
MAMIKENLIALLKILEKDYKFRIESSYDEQDSDKWSKFHEEIRQQRLTMQKGGIK